MSVVFKYINLGFKSQILELKNSPTPLAVSNLCSILVDDNT